ncbi:GTPase IMAP family member 9-like [Lepisosteus oculatus]|uniref:GTPase IMAP family member 9-like n=1 Tax=Lepisosteus oculatus TaxID=7918 RepID=UPI0035F52CB7
MRTPLHHHQGQARGFDVAQDRDVLPVHKRDEDVLSDVLPEDGEDYYGSRSQLRLQFLRIPESRFLRFRSFPVNCAPTCGPEPAVLLERSERRPGRTEGEGQADAHEAPQRLSEIRIVLLGQRWSGKSSAGNTILGREEFDTEGETKECEKRQGEVAGRKITVVDTQGWGSSFIRADPKCVREEVVRSVSLCPPGPHTLLLVINLNSDTDWRSVKEHLELLSERVWRHTIVLFTWGDRLRETTIEQHIETGGKELQWMVEKCGNRYHVLNNKNRGDRTQVTELLEKIEDMVAGNYGQYFTTNIKEINTELEKYIRQREEQRQRDTEELRQSSLTAWGKKLF